jgi:sugar/nucleoside kinase (ribokinase family)
MDFVAQPLVLCVGRNSVDIGLDVDLELLRADGKQRSGPANVTVGGQCVNAAVTLAGLGAQVAYAGVIGESDGGDMVKSFLADRNVDFSLSALVPDTPNASAYVLVDGRTGERTIIESAPDLYPALGPVVLPAQCGYVYFDGNELPASHDIAGQAQQAGIPTLTDMEVLTEDTLALLRSVDTAIVPLPIAVELAGTDDRQLMLRMLTALGPDRVAITMGEQGAVGRDAEGIVHDIAPVPCAVTDTTGAGDAFHAGFLFADSNGLAFPKALAFAARVASLKCETRGPSTDADALAELALTLQD